MEVATLLKDGALRVYDYRCSAGPADRPFTEQHGSYSVSYVRRGSFGYRTCGRAYELVAGAFLLGRPGDEFLCTHEHHGAGDECLSYHFDAELLDSLGLPCRKWMSGAVPVLPQLALLGERAQAAAAGASDVGLDEAGTLLAAALTHAQGPTAVAPPRVTARDRRRAVRVALWLDAHCAEPIQLERVAREAGVSAFHFLRLFTRVTGVTPHQYLVRSRLRHAARRLAQGSQAIGEIAYQVGLGIFPTSCAPSGVRPASRRARSGAPASRSARFSKTACADRP